MSSGLVLYDGAVLTCWLKIVYEVQVPDEYDQISQQDTAAAFDYTPKSAWSKNPESVSKYSGGTGQ